MEGISQARRTPGPVIAGLCDVLDPGMEPRFWYRSGTGGGSWILGVDWLLRWMEHSDASTVSASTTSSISARSPSPTGHDHRRPYPQASRSSTPRERFLATAGAQARIDGGDGSSTAPSGTGLGTIPRAGQAKRTAMPG
jgi:hypothetical protein